MQKKRAIDHIQQVNNQDFRLHIFTALKAATCNASILKRGWAIGGGKCAAIRLHPAVCWPLGCCLTRKERPSTYIDQLFSFFPYSFMLFYGSIYLCV